MHRFFSYLRAYAAIGLCAVSANDFVIDIIAPADGEGFDLSYPQPELSLKFEDGPITTLVKSSPGDFEICVNFDEPELLSPESTPRTLVGRNDDEQQEEEAHNDNAAQVLSLWSAQLSPTLLCRGVTDAVGFSAPSGSVVPSEGRHTFRVWLRPKSGTLTMGHAMRALDKVRGQREKKKEVVKDDSGGGGGTTRKLDGGDIVSDAVVSDAWAAAAPTWIRAASSSTTFFTSREGLHLQVLSPQAGFAYGGGAVAAQLIFGGVVGYSLCIDWDAAPAHKDGGDGHNGGGGDGHHNHNHRDDHGHNSNGYHSDSASYTAASALTVSTSPECHALVAGGGGGPSFTDSPSPQLTRQGNKIFRAWLQKEEDTEVQRGAGGGGKAFAAAVVERLVVEVPYSTYRINPDEDDANTSAAARADDDDGGGGNDGGGGSSSGSTTRSAMKSERVVQLWRNLGLGGGGKGRDKNSDGDATDDDHDDDDGWMELTAIAARRKESMEASLDPLQRIDRIPGLSRDGKVNGVGE